MCETCSGATYRAVQRGSTPQLPISKLDGVVYFSAGRKEDELNMRIRVTRI